MQPIPPQPGSSIDPRHAVGRGATTEAARRDLTRGNNLYDERSAHAEELLDRAAVADAAVPEKGLSPEHRAVVDDLVDDHYLVRTSEGLRWRYGVLRHIWTVRRGLA